MCENKCCYVSTGLGSDCSYEVTCTKNSAGKEGDPYIVGEVASPGVYFDGSVGTGINTKVFLNNNQLPLITDFSFSQAFQMGVLECVVSDKTLPEMFVDGIELRILVTIMGSDIVLYCEKVKIVDKTIMCSSEDNLLKMKVVFEKCKEKRFDSMVPLSAFLKVLGQATKNIQRLKNYL